MSLTTKNNFAAAAKIAKTLGMLAIGFLMAAPAGAGVVFTWNLTSYGGGSFTADALKANEVSHIEFTDANGNWAEQGYARITGISNGGVVTVPTGLNTAYTLYIDFQGTGNSNTGTFSTATETLYVVQGASAFGIDANNDAYVDNGSNSPTALANSNLIWGTSGLDGSGLFAYLLASFTPTVAVAAVFEDPTPFPGLFFGHFTHPFSEANGVTFVADGIVLNGGDDTLSFIPEPASLLLMAAALPGMLLGRRRLNATAA